MTEGDRKRQIYLGRETPELLAEIDARRSERSERAGDERARRDLVAMIAAGGAARESAAVVQVLRILADAGVFRMRRPPHVDRVRRPDPAAPVIVYKSGGPRRRSFGVRRQSRRFRT